jgi:NAD(P)-dependent dehydrogenase (short-subunit alcohol dehydrogenase family)
MSKVILVTGTSTGFGRTAAEALAQRGYTVFATMRDSSGRNASTAEALESLARRKGWNLDVLDMDVTSVVSTK